MVLYRAAVTGCAGKYQCSAKRLIRSLTSSATSHRRMGIIRYHNSASVACNHEVTIITIKPVHARALVAAYPLQTYSSISTRRRGALVSNFRAGISGIASCAGAAVSIAPICAWTVVLARGRIAFVYVFDAVGSLPPCSAVTLICVCRSALAAVPVPTGVGQALVNIGSAVEATVPRPTAAGVGVCVWSLA